MAAAATGALSVALFSNQFASASGHGIARYSRDLYYALAARLCVVNGHELRHWTHTQIAQQRKCRSFGYGSRRKASWKFSQYPFTKKYCMMVTKRHKM